MGTEGKIKVDEHYPTDADEPPLLHIKKIESIRSNVKFEQCYESSKLIGDGKFGKVYQVREKASGNEFAAKVIRIKQQADRAEVEREVSILTQLRHPRIAQIYDAFYTANNEVVLVMEIVRGGELFDRVADENYVLTELAVVMIICQLCEAIDYIHEQNILHLDIKPENIMCVSQTGNRIKLIDFGLARYYDGTQELRYMAGTPEFAAPEVIKYEQLDYHTDMWSVGVITYILLSGYSPFLGENICETYCNVEKGAWDFTEEFESVSLEAKDFISNLIVYKKEKRMLPKECLAHPWIARHRAKVNCDAILERPAEGPIMDNRQIMRYNAQRKLRRVIIYVRFLIEMNRLRSMVKGRMSQSGIKYFEPLLKMAEEKEQVTKGIPIAGTSKALEPKSLEKPETAEKQGSDEQLSAGEGTGRSRKPTASTRIKRITTSSSPERKKTAPVVVQKPPKVALVADLLKASSAQKASMTAKQERLDQNDGLYRLAEKTAAPETSKLKSDFATDVTSERIPPTKIRSRSKTPVKNSAAVEKQSIPEVVITEPPKSTSSAETKTIEKTDRKKKLSKSTAGSAAPVAEKSLKKKETSKPVEELAPLARSSSLERPELRIDQSERRSIREKKLTPTDPSAAKPPRPASPSELTARTSTKKQKSTSPVEQRVLGTASSLDEALNKIRTTTTAEAVESSSLRVRKSSAPEAIITVPPKKTVLGAPPNASGCTESDRTTPIRMQRFGSSESGDSAKENRVLEEKKPTRQGALRKKEKLAENAELIGVASSTSQLPPAPAPLQKSSSISTLLRKRGSVDDVKPEVSSITKVSPNPVSNPSDNSDAKPIAPRPGSIQERLMKLNCNSAPLTMNVASSAAKPPRVPAFLDNKDAPRIEEPKKGKTLPITTESKTVTTTLTSTSTKTKKASVEKKVQHVSDGKTVEEVQRTSTEQDKINVSKITMRKAESLDKPGTTTTVKKNVVKQDSLRSTAEKERTEEQSKDAAKTKRTARSALTKTTDKVTVEESSKFSVTKRENKEVPLDAEATKFEKDTKNLVTVDGKPKKLSVAGTTDVTHKVVEKSEVKTDRLGKPTKKTELTATEEVKTALDVEKNAKKGTIEKSSVTKVVTKSSDPPCDGKDADKGKPSPKTTTTSPLSSKTRESSKDVKEKPNSHPASTAVLKTGASSTQLSLPSKIDSGNEAKKDVPKSASSSKSSMKKQDDDSIPATVTRTTTVTVSKTENSSKPMKKRATISDKETFTELVPREDFSFDSLKEKLERRMSTDLPKEESPKKECISIPTISSVRDRLRKFEGKT